MGHSASRNSRPDQDERDHPGPVSPGTGRDASILRVDTVNDPAGPVARRLVEDGHLAPDDLERALRARDRFGEDLRQILDKLGLIAQDVWAQTAADISGLPLVGPAGLEDAVLPDSIAVEFLRDRTILVLGDSDPPAADHAPQGPEPGTMLAMADPTDDYAHEAVCLALHGAPLRRCVALARDIETALDRLEGIEDDSAVSGNTASAGPDDAPFAATDLDERDLDDIDRLRGLASEAPIIRLVNTMIHRALEQGASDIHIEPFERYLVVRYRIDGLLYEVERPQRRHAAAIVSRIKILAQLDIAERRLAQDGRIRHRTEGQEIDLRVSTVPSLHGESVVIRILDQGGPPPALTELGFTQAQLRQVARELERKNGLLIVTGPTGSGKTTTLYGAVHRLNKTDRKIITVEDPVEFQIPGVIQTQVKAEIGYDFPRILRGLLRQDPDILMIGEIRDGETARIAAQSALTGHLVLSTLHTNDAVSAVTRLLDMGLEDYLITATLNLAVAQRLVRVLCSDCAVETAPPPELQHLEMSLRARITGPAPRFKEAIGCSACQGRGYKGRMALYELFTVTEPIRRAILAGKDTDTLRALARDSGQTSLFQDGLAKAARGQTSMEEVRRVAQDDPLHDD